MSARVLALALAGVALAARGAAAAMPLSAHSEVRALYTTEVFPDDPQSTPDRVAVLAGGLGTRWKPGRTLRVELLAGVTAERYQRWTPRDAETWESELRVRLAASRLRVRGRFTPTLMLYPDPVGGATYREREVLVGLDAHAAGGLTGGLELRAADQRYDELHPGRTETRVRWGYLAGWESPAARGATLQFENERAVAEDAEYDFWDNRLTASGWARLGSVALRGELQEGVRNYFPTTIFAANYRRHDHAQAFRLEASRALGGPLALTLREEYRRRDSTRADRTFRMNTVGLGLDWKLGR